MLTGRTALVVSSQCRSYTTKHGLRPIPILPDATLETFRKDAFEPATPALLPRQTFNQLPAVRRWFIPASNGNVALNRHYLARFGATIVPLEITNNDKFTRIEQSLSFFLECVNASSSTYDVRPSRYFNAYRPGARAVRRTAQSNTFFSAAALTPPTARVYLAQASINDLPRALRDDLPVPDLVLKSGKGDVYDSSIWIGQAPTYTPLHRDPNPNLFVQLAGTKVVRLFRPDAGRAIFAKVQEVIGGNASATMRGDEMMQGAEKKALESEVWDDDAASGRLGFEAELNKGDGLFIPKGWWHSIKGTGDGMTGSCAGQLVVSIEQANTVLIYAIALTPDS
ncbi:hypothetical protein LTR02_010218 [Friedmanniomyces endolithicus]|nr:hypothetical protein LTR59_002243 [Friedmanniomyces endolithicus]KAK0811999.1 hypothetical protein LTR38_003434 [Friedmanniomyces endolithicus]KAK0844435.1 hypothetical protein LTS02_015704 [Friedmanniomyces endolithicus]KAK0854937.1 hypothetical protein LTR03_002045 [Friedmanniomyces endolithicus]KAK0898333.1 hypothetical protein LTR02_010218 [Friedmanniomyces endolithicus]